jgi:hypothetical protein
MYSVLRPPYLKDKPPPPSNQAQAICGRGHTTSGPFAFRLCHLPFPFPSRLRLRCAASPVPAGQQQQPPHSCQIHLLFCLLIIPSPLPMEDTSPDTKPIPTYGRHSKKEERRPSKPLKRTSVAGDSITSTSGGFPSTKSTARDRAAMAASFLQYWYGETPPLSPVQFDIRCTDMTWISALCARNKS